MSSSSRSTGIWSGEYLWVTLGAVAMIFLAATQALAVTTVMPLVSADLDGEALYAVAFSATVATSVIGMVAAGAWCDRGGVLAPLSTSVLLFVLGLVVAGAAASMEWVVIGRLIQGLGTGGQTVSLYVVVARVYPAMVHGRVFAAFSAAWVIPSLVGPLLAGAVAEFFHWRWVFLGVAALTLSAFAVVVARLRGLPLDAPERGATDVGRRLAWATALAVSAVALSLAGEAGPARIPIIVVAVVAIAVTVRPLLPSGALRARRGLPSVILMRGVIAGALFGAEIYVPYLLIDEYGFSATWAGLGLTAAALAWAAAAEVQGRVGDRLGNRRITLIGVAFLASSMAIVGLVAVTHAHPGILIAGWGLSGAGMGLMYPRLTVLTLAYSTTQNQGFNSAALSISDAVGAATTIAVMGLVYTGLGGGILAFTWVFALGTIVALAALVPGLRLGHGAEVRATTVPT
ncbi:MFS transporter [Microbacterium aurantiacum]|uniref:MFS transporter n=1 Tax=Microbacterium aurantiacum TaxID=162393 RepID=A0AAJ2HH08_9MICO|nr:MFS transporter [Microbacterium aurantiacum]MDS0246016.1 MFS transporter [Microbacterium aurantiacum]